MRTFNFHLFLLGVIIISAFGCKKNVTTDTPVYSLINKWRLSSIQNKSTMQITDYPNNYSVKESVEFMNDSTMIFYGICNGGRAKYFFKNNDLTISNLCTSQVLCSNYIWEDYLRNNLDSAYLYYITGNKLEIYSKGNYNLNFVLETSK